MCFWYVDVGDDDDDDNDDGDDVDGRDESGILIKITPSAMRKFD